MGVGAAIAGAGVLGAGASIAGGVMGAGAAKSAADVQAQAALQASRNQMDMFNQIKAQLQPFTAGGQGAFGQLLSMTGAGPGGNPLTAPLTQPFNFTPDQLANLPGYQFMLNQGLQATQSGYAAQGLGRSGAALKGAANYAEGLAQSNFGTAYGLDLAQKQQAYNMLFGQAQLGENAAAQTGTFGTQAQTQANQFATSGAAATAGGIVGGQNALTAGLTGAAGQLGNAGLLYGMNTVGMFGTPGTGGNPAVGGQIPLSNVPSYAFAGAPPLSIEGWS